MAESSTKPYLIRALYEWCCDNGYTPYLAVVVDRHTQVPRHHVKNGEIVLNVSPMATNHMAMGNDLIEFQARFSGVAQQLSIPVENVAAIYARETGHGMAFEVARPAPIEEGGEAATSQGEGAGLNDAVPAAAADAVPAASPAQDTPGTARMPAAGRKRAGKAQGGADVIAFASPPGGRNRTEPAARRGAGKGGAGTLQPPAGEDQAPAAEAATDTTGKGDSLAGPKGDRATQQDAGEGAANANGAEPSARHPDDHDEPPPSGGKGGRTRLTRVK